MPARMMPRFILHGLRPRPSIGLGFGVFQHRPELFEEFVRGGLGGICGIGDLEHAFRLPGLSKVRPFPRAAFVAVEKEQQPGRAKVGVFEPIFEKKPPKAVILFRKEVTVD